MGRGCGIQGARGETAARCMQNNFGPQCRLSDFSFVLWHRVCRRGLAVFGGGIELLPFPSRSLPLALPLSPLTTPFDIQCPFWAWLFDMTGRSNAWMAQGGRICLK